jgi:hypothetical protein
MIENQIAQIATTLPIPDSGKISRQPETPLETIKTVSTRFGKPLCQENHDYLVDPPFITKKEDPSRPIICNILDVTKLTKP